MFKQKKKTAIGSALIALCMAASSMALPANAAPQRIVLPTVSVTPVQEPILVDHRRHHRKHRDHRGYYRNNGHHYYNGHRGYRERRRGYREHNGWWFPPAAFALGAVIGSQVQPQRQPQYAPRGRGFSRDHYRWCSNRYRSYDPRSNTFQPYNGPRRQCRSPY